MMDIATRSLLVSERQFSRVVVTCVLLGFLALIAAGGVAAWAVSRTEAHAGWVKHTYEVEGDIADLRLLIERLETQRRGYLLNRSPRFAQRFVATVAQEPHVVAALRGAIVDNSPQQTRIDRIERLAASHIRLLAGSIQRRAQGRVEDFERDGSVDLTRALRRYTEAMVVAERGLLAQRIAAQERSARLVWASLAVSGLLIVLVAIFSVSVILRFTRDLVRSRDEQVRLNETLEQRVVERTRELSRANDEIQRFAYIVSHDLRSPLVNVMGFTGELEAAARPLAALVDAAERDAPALVTEDARLAAREDLPEAIGFIRSSTQKMDRLINAILRLSREGRRVLASEPLDLAAMADGVVASLRHGVDAIGAEMTVARPMPALDADRLAVEQILSNLAENAVKYLAPGRPGRIAIAAHRIADRVAISVEDNGRGIDPRDHDRVFDLFRRSGQQDQPGEGIGLAHVRALAYRLGGLVECRSALGQGSTFTLTLPAVPPAHQG